MARGRPRMPPSTWLSVLWPLLLLMMIVDGAAGQLTVYEGENATVVAYDLPGFVAPPAEYAAQMMPLTFKEPCSLFLDFDPTPPRWLKDPLALSFSYESAVYNSSCWSLDRAVSTAIAQLERFWNIRPVLVVVSVESSLQLLGTRLFLNYGVAPGLTHSPYNSQDWPRVVIVQDASVQIPKGFTPVRLQSERHPITVEAQDSVYVRMCRIMATALAIVGLIAVVVTALKIVSIRRQRLLLDWRPIVALVAIAVLCILRAYAYASYDMHGLGTDAFGGGAARMPSLAVWFGFCMLSYICAVVSMRATVSLWIEQVLKFPVVLNTAYLRHVLVVIQRLFDATLVALAFLMIIVCILLMPAGTLTNATTLLQLSQAATVCVAVLFFAFPIVTHMFNIPFIILFIRNGGRIDMVYVRIGAAVISMNILASIASVLLVFFALTDMPMTVPPFTTRTSIFLLTDICFMLVSVVMLVSHIIGVQRIAGNGRGAAFARADYYFARWHLLAHALFSSEEMQRASCRQEGAQCDRSLALNAVAQVRARSRKSPDAQTADGFHLLEQAPSGLLEGDGWAAKIDDFYQATPQRQRYERQQDARYEAMASGALADPRDKALRALQNQLQAQAQASPATTLRLVGIGLLELPESQLLAVHPRALQCTAIDLSQNALPVVPPVIMARFTHLSLLDLSGNLLSALPDDIADLAELTALYLNWNRLTALPARFGSLGKLQTLWLGANALTAFPPQVQSLPALRELVLCDNQIRQLPEETFNESLPFCGLLEVLDVSGNDLRWLPDTLGVCAGLVELRADRNRLTVIPPSIFALRRLRVLSLYANEIAHLPGGDVRRLLRARAEDGGQPLEVLDLSANELARLPRELWRLTGLRDLRLDMNQLRMLSPEVRQLVGLRHFSLRQNELAYLPCEVEMLPALEHLDVRGNRVRTSPLLTWWVFGGANAISWSALMLVTVACAVLWLFAAIFGVVFSERGLEGDILPLQEAYGLIVPVFTVAVVGLPAVIVFLGRMQFFSDAAGRAGGAAAFQWNWYNAAAVLMLAVEAVQLCALAFEVAVPWAGPLRNRPRLLDYLVFDLSSQGDVLVLFAVATLAVVLFRALIELRVALHGLVTLTFLLHMASNMLLIPVLFVLAKPLNCVFSRTWPAGALLSAGPVRCFSIDHVLLLVTGLAAQSLFVPTATLASPVWQQRVQRLQLRYRPRVVVALLLTKYAQAVTVNLFGARAIARAVINTLFISGQLVVWLASRPSHLPQVNLWRAVAFAAAALCSLGAVWTTAANEGQPENQQTAAPAYALFAALVSIGVVALVVSLKGRTEAAWLAFFEPPAPTDDEQIAAAPPTSARPRTRRPATSSQTLSRPLVAGDTHVYEELTDVSYASSAATTRTATLYD